MIIPVTEVSVPMGLGEETEMEWGRLKDEHKGACIVMGFVRNKREV